MGVKQWCFMLRLPMGFKTHIKAMAKDEDRSVNGLILNILKKEIVKFRKERGETQPDLFDHESDSEK